MAQHIPCRHCDIDETWELIRKHCDKGLDQHWSRTRLCAKCKVATKVYKHYANRVLREHENDLQPQFEQACEYFHNSHNARKRSDPYSCGGCGYSRITKKLPRLDNAVVRDLLEEGIPEMGRLPSPRKYREAEASGGCVDHIVCVNVLASKTV